MSTQVENRFSEFIVDRVGFGIFAVTRDMQLVLWNRFMQQHSGKKAEEIIGKNLFDCFPELPRKWLQKKFEGVFLLKNFSFISWEQRPYLFQFKHDRPVTGGVDWMQQNCTFMPMINAANEVEMVCVTIADVTDISIIQRQLQSALVALGESANRDGLTGIYNRRHLEERLAQEFSRCKRYGGGFSLLMFDLDHFKRVNDQYGHLGGDAVLRAAAARVTNVIRTADIFGRYGGEEFALILPETDLAAATIVGEKVRKAIGETPIEFDGQKLTATTSVGITTMRSDLPAYEALIHEADTALYRAKGLGRNCVVVAGSDIEPLKIS
ncbi:MAG: diguanylate cyclase [Pseudomonadota bacterium]